MAEFNGDDMDAETMMAIIASQRGSETDGDDDDPFVRIQIALFNAMEAEQLENPGNLGNQPTRETQSQNQNLAQLETFRQTSQREAEKNQQKIEIVLAAQRKMLEESMKTILNNKTEEAVRDAKKKKMLLDVLKSKFSSVNVEFLERMISWFSPLSCFLICHIIDIGMIDSLISSNDSRLLNLLDEHPLQISKNSKPATNCILPDWLEDDWEKYIDIVKKDYASEVSKFECQVCFTTTHIANGVYCVNLYEEQFVNDYDGITRADSHRVCDDCLRGMAKSAAEDAAIARGGVGLKCIDPNCQGVILYAHVSPHLKDDEIRTRLHKRLQQEAIAVLQGLESCKKCQYTMQIEISKEELQTFQCPECQAEFCRTCKIDWKDHLNSSGQAKKCEDVMSPEDYKRIKLEEKMSEAILRQCSCGAALQKAEGCNKMTCRCGRTMCYLCKQLNIGYDHFGENKPCQLFEDYKRVDRANLDAIVLDVQRDEHLKEVANKLHK